MWLRTLPKELNTDPDRRMTSRDRTYERERENETYISFPADDYREGVLLCLVNSGKKNHPTFLIA